MTQSSHRLCLIPARGGSKRLPRKNILPFLGKPMLAWTIECARASELFEPIHVSTEDEEIGQIAEANGAVWARRPSTLAGDYATIDEVCRQFMDQEEKAGRHYETLVVLYPAAPLRSPEDIRDTVRLVEEDGADFAMTVTQFPYEPFEALIVRDDGAAEIWQPDMFAMPGKDRPELRIDAGSVYAVRVSAFKRIRDFYGPNMKVKEVPAERAVDIDTAEDLSHAEFYAHRLNKRGAA